MYNVREVDPLLGSSADDESTNENEQLQLFHNSEAADLLKTTWHALTSERKRLVILSLFPKCKTDKQLAANQKYFVDYVMSTNPNTMRMWGEDRVDDLYQAFNKLIAKRDIKDWISARRMIMKQNRKSMQQDLRI